MLERPDFVMIAGDLAYYKGRLADYLDEVFPTYNDDALTPSSGAPLLRSTLTLVAPGNHDLLERDLDVYPDALFYFLAWSLPLNGPLAVPGPANTPSLRGAEARRRAFLDAAGPAYPRMANYSFDFGDAHWTVLDTNPYADWTDPALRDWLARDLEAARARRGGSSRSTSPRSTRRGSTPTSRRRASWPSCSRSTASTWSSAATSTTISGLIRSASPPRRAPAAGWSTPRGTSRADGRSTAPSTAAPAPAPTA